MMRDKRSSQKPARLQAPPPAAILLSALPAAAPSSTTQAAAPAACAPSRPRMLRAARRGCVRAMATAARSKPPLRGVVCDMDGARRAGATRRGASAAVRSLWWRHLRAACPRR